jgi:hypothetical protein
VKDVVHSARFVQFWVLLGFGILGMVSHYTYKWLTDEIKGCLYSYLFECYPKRTALAFFTLLGWAFVTALSTNVLDWGLVINVGLSTGFAIDALINKAKRAVADTEETKGP